MKKNTRFFFTIFPIVFFITWVWFVFVKLENDSIVEIESLISKKKWEEALKKIEDNLRRERQSNKMHLYVLGSAVSFGLEENSIDLEKSKEKTKKSVNYDHQLIRRDATGLFLKESFLYRIKLFPKSVRTLKLVCEYMDYFPNIDFWDGSFIESIQNTISTYTEWERVDQECFKDFFSSPHILPDHYKRRVAVLYAALRANPHKLSQKLISLKKGDTLLFRKKSQHKKSEGWGYVVDDNQRAGWVRHTQLEPLAPIGLSEVSN